MKKVFLSLTLIAGIALVSCEKEKVESNFTSEASSETETLRLPESGYDMNVTETLTKSSGDVYTSGVIEYTKNGNVLATFDFGAGEEDKAARYEKDGKSYDCSLEKEEKDWDKKEKKGYKKVIIEPIVKSDDCGYIVSGIIKYYDMKTGEWTATVDFGDGTCDDSAIKTTEEGDYTFTVSEHY
jgi:hypothetical protein